MIMSFRSVAGCSSIRKLLDDRGLSTVEYVIILVLIAAAAVAAWTSFGEHLKNKLKSADDSVSTIHT